MQLTDTNLEQVGCGADELIDLLLRCVLNEGDKIVDCPPTFTMYAFDSEVNAGEVVTVPRLDGFKLDLPGIRAAVTVHRPKVVFLTSPNNPDGSTITEEELLAILDMPVLVVLDEAYVEFSGEETRMPWVTSRPNLIVLRTFSKSAGLAGLRVGYASHENIRSNILFVSFIVTWATLHQHEDVCLTNFTLAVFVLQCFGVPATPSALHAHLFMHLVVGVQVRSISA
jgi:histidinol-phosphate/aromatic aminotransferase/cobyric acid decarboxylase-like protein